MTPASTVRTDDLLDALIKTLKAQQEKKGFSPEASTSFTLGYINSFLSGVIMSLPKAQQKRINAVLIDRINVNR